MKQNRVASLLVLLITIIVVATWDNTLSRSFVDEPEEAPTQVAEAPSGTSAETPPNSVLDPVVTSTAVPQPTDPPTPVPTIEPTPEPTAEPEETPRPPAPENASSQSYMIQRGESDRVEVALTFDAGEGVGYTEEILDLLAEYDIRASFGLTGEWVREHPELTRRIIEEGHHVINHSETHASWTGLSTSVDPLTEAERISELETPEAAVLDVAGYETKPYYRPPYGDMDPEGLTLLKDQGYDYTAMWSCDTLAWMGDAPDVIAERCHPDSEGGGPGAIILMHVAQENDWLALEQIITDYAAAGYDFVTIEQMIQP